MKKTAVPRDDIIFALLSMVQQYMSDDGGLIRHEFMSAQEEALDVLLRLGLIEPVGDEKFKVKL